ncbi:MAG TPA: ribosome maturation factor RimP [Gammaproteobacteria bacterium]|nr:ribosome maturation factor RimP [Gammaproteobacteria bacterium]
MKRAAPRIFECVGPVVQQLGYQFVGASYGQSENGLTLRVFIDHEKGITVDDCAVVSHQLSGVLDIEEPIKEPYVLEVSSPGLDRPLFTVDDFQKYEGAIVQVRMAVGQENNRKRFKGFILASDSDSDSVIIEVDGKEYKLFINEMDEAKLVPDFT